MGERHVSINLAFHTHLQEHHKNNINQFLVLLKVIPTKEEEAIATFAGFFKIKNSCVAYMQGFEDVLAQRFAHQAKAKKKVAENKAMREIKEKE